MVRPKADRAGAMVSQQLLNIIETACDFVELGFQATTLEKFVKQVGRPP